MVLGPKTAIIACLTLILIWRIWQVFPLKSNASLTMDSPGVFLDLRQKLADNSDLLLPKTQAALMSGIVLGYKSDLPADFKQGLTNTSTIHIVVASGENLTLLSGFLLTFSPLFGRKKIILLNIPVSILYSLLTGLQIPIIRAALMIIFTGIGKLFDREVDSWYSLVLVGLLMLIFEPNWLLSVSFQLSFLATLGVIVLAPELLKKANFLPEVIKQDLVVSFCAQAITAPIIAANFHQFSLSGLLVNALVLWCVSPIMISGAIVLIISFIFLPLASILVLVPNILLTFFIYIISFFNQSWSLLWVGKTNLYFWFGYYTLLTAIYFKLRDINQRSKQAQELSLTTS